jgi:hypothetical protein
MSFARNIIRDLIDKRLWPVALLMAVAIVAIPVLGGGMSSPKTTTDQALPIAPDAAAANTSSAVELLGPPAVRKRPGKLVDPFRRKPKKKETTVVVTEPGAGAGAKTDTPAAPATPTTTVPKASLNVYRTSVRWSADSTGKARRLLRLTPLGDDVLNPAALYLGVSKDGKHALFLLGADATSDGDAHCREASCRVISMSSGDTQIVDLKPDGAEPSQFELEVTAVQRHKLGSATEAATARRRVHPDGHDVLLLMLEDAKTATAMTGFGYDRRLGVIVNTSDQSAQAGT